MVWIHLYGFKYQYILAIFPIAYHEAKTCTYREPGSQKLKNFPWVRNHQNSTSCIKFIKKKRVKEPSCAESEIQFQLLGRLRGQ